jgi:hypothetical protein
MARRSTISAARAELDRQARQADGWQGGRLDRLGLPVRDRALTGDLDRTAMSKVAAGA